MNNSSVSYATASSIYLRIMDLKEARMKCDRTIADIAYIMGVSEGTVRGWEKCDRKISLKIEDMPKLWAAYGLQPDMDAAVDAISDSKPGVWHLLEESERKARWDRDWIRMSLVIPRSVEEDVNRACAYLQRKGVVMHEHPILRLGICFRWALVSLLEEAAWPEQEDEVA